MVLITTVSALGTIICVADDLRYIKSWRVYRCFLITLVRGDVLIFLLLCFLCLGDVASIFEVLGSWVEVSLAKFLQPGG